MRRLSSIGEKLRSAPVEYTRFDVRTLKYAFYG